jgi:hypothetical protein
MHEYVCGQHALFGMSASWEVATATQITRSGATTTGTLAIQLADHIGGYRVSLRRGAVTVGNEAPVWQGGSVPATLA